MNFNQFTSECVGIAIDNWQHLLIGMFNIVDEDWGKLAPIPADNPLSKNWKSVDSDMYVRLKDVKLLKVIKYDDSIKTNQSESNIPGFRPGQVTG